MIRLFLKFFLCLLMTLLTVVATADDQTPTFYTLNRHDGLSDNNVLQLMQLADGRILSVESEALDIYDGISFSHIRRQETDARPLQNYFGATHVYIDDEDHLWLKSWYSIACYDLRRLCPWEEMDSVLPDSLLDFFIDSRGQRWYVMKDGIYEDDSDIKLTPSSPDLIPQDIDCMGDTVYVFFNTGTLSAYALADGTLIYSSDAYPVSERQLYDHTSLVIQGPDSCFYQIRTKQYRSIFLRFDPQRRQWKRLMAVNHLLHSMVIQPNGIAYITLPDGYLRYDLSNGDVIYFKDLHLPDGSLLGTGVNAFCQDRTGGIWLGTYDKGIIYTSPLSGLFDTQTLDIPLRPILSAIYLHSQKVMHDSIYGGDQPLITEEPPYVRHLSLRHDQNSIAFQFSTMNYVRPHATCYRYSLNGDWHTVTADSASAGYVDNRGALYLPLVSLAPGHYQLDVMAASRPDRWDDAETVTLTFDVLPPWWQTLWAKALFTLVSLIIVAGLVFVYVRSLRRRMERDAREQQLMLRIQNLAEQVNQYESAAAQLVLYEPAAEQSSETAEETEETTGPSPQDIEFMNRATQLVEQHLADPQYTVDQLARDLCMERTGLYKRLMALMSTAPVVFIRSIRLHRAAELIREGNHTITEISELTGFGTVSYFGKCFQREFGCKPSEYAANPD